MADTAPVLHALAYVASYQGTHLSLSLSPLSSMPSFIVWATALALTTSIHAAVFNVQAPTAAMSNGNLTIIWESDTSDDAPVTIALFSTDQSYNGPLAIANDVDPQANKASVVLPHLIPGPGYTIGLISMSNTTEVLASSPPFSIAPAAIASTTKSSVSSVLLVSSSAHASRARSESSAHFPSSSGTITRTISEPASSTLPALPSIPSADLPLLSGTSATASASANAYTNDATQARPALMGPAFLLGFSMGAWIV
ncbi:hypothetical protein DFH06DRAFT_1338831 [Mycena polygramma]|nr:hypothetical protein DFH06DRAFT_1338831 [Mycena polygramma]